MSRRTLVFSVLAAACVAAAVASALIAVLGSQSRRAASDRAVALARPHAQKLLGGDGAFVVFRHLDKRRPATYGRTAIAALHGTRVGPAVLAGPPCERVAFGAHEGLCLEVVGTEMTVHVLDSHMRSTRAVTLPGIPSRARISPDGRWGGTTAFVVGHAYASPGQFSTSTTIIDMRTGRPTANLEKDFTATNGGKVVDARDRNYWGLTFAADGDTFYATLAEGTRTWLVKGSIRARRAHTIHQNVECPSLSPDGTRIAYKQAIAHNPTRWRFHVLDLASGRDVALAETRSVDDQLDWLDNGHLLYGEDEQTWIVNADGSGRPRVWLDHSDSPTVQGGASPAA